MLPEAKSGDVCVFCVHVRAYDMHILLILVIVYCRS
jgi:hypothetical protein